MSFRPALLFPVLSSALVLAACGGGGGGDKNDGGTTPIEVESTLSGVAAVGAPLGGAAISVIDAKGQALGSTSAHPVEGSYSLKLSSKSFTMPLLVQARGMDAAGAPQLLHSSVQGTAAAAMVAHVTPLTQAAVALALGADPAPLFAKGSESATALASLSQTVVAADFLKTLIKTQLTDLKISDPTKLDLLADPTFAANKGSHDVLLESLRVGLAKNAQGVEQLQLANKLLASQAGEVLVDLPTAKTELAKTTGATPANAISSTLKATTSATGVLPNLGQLDELGAALNKLIAQGANAAALAASPHLSAYDKHNGRSGSELAALLAGYATKNWQFGRFLVTGCADEVVTAGNCSRVLVSAPISDSSGALVDLFTDALSFNKSATTGTPKWSFIGNGKKLEFSVHPVAWLALESSGALSSGLPAGNPGAGVQLLLQAQNGAGTALLDKATVQTPGGFSIPLAYCAQRWLCISPTSGASSVEPTGALSDQLLQPATVGWLGGADTLRNAKYLASYTPSGATAAESRVAWLRAELPASVPPQPRYPALDGISGSAPLTAAGLAAGLNLNWSAWAKSNPDLRLMRVRVVIRNSGASVVQRDFTPAYGVSASTLSLPQIGAAAGALGQELWLRAQDGAGRFYDTRYTVQR
ncbi:hypothetical protein G8A07_20305 [Roseateles sp. DAIF2]|uniref:hypothetical protein n=1 Tax=Roseateles sp. DAIF2 TaxID=2714952 RepID=UPI0018A32B38|nr:hypothetical protein [Roseateles sp. DAIF2]QPF75026.1 hypothetical protein G8A07_20305 [Roseateles sp. DAIF2]